MFSLTLEKWGRGSTLEVFKCLYCYWFRAAITGMAKVNMAKLKLLQNSPELTKTCPLWVVGHSKGSDCLIQSDKKVLIDSPPPLLRSPSSPLWLGCTREKTWLLFYDIDTTPNWFHRFERKTRTLILICLLFNSIHALCMFCWFFLFGIDCLLDSSIIIWKLAVAWILFSSGVIMENESCTLC